MIPDHLIDKAARAFHESSTFNVVAWDRLGKNSVTRTMPRKYARAILEAVAADIWDEGWAQGMAYVTGMERGTDDDLDHTITNPYRASEGK